MKKVLQVVACLEKGGTEAYIMNNFRHINRSEVAFDFLVFDERAYEYINEIEDLGGKVFFVGRPIKKNIISFVKKFYGFINQNGPYYAIHSHINITNSIIMLLAYFAKIPIRISHSHGMNYASGFKKVGFFIKRQVLRMFATHKLACSSQAGESLYGKSYFEKNGIVLNNGIDVDKFTNVNEKAVEELRKEFNITKDNFVVGNISRFDRNKNISFIVDIFAKVLEKKKIPFCC